MKILYAITKSNWGGAQRHVYDLAMAMKSAGDEVFAAVGGEGLLKEKLEKAGIYTYSIGSMSRDVSVSKDAGSFKELYSVIKEKRPDVLHLHSPKAAGLGALAGRLLGIKKIIYTVHGWTFNESRPLYERALIAFFSWMTMILCHQVILISNREYKQTNVSPLSKRNSCSYLSAYKRLFSCPSTEQNNSLQRKSTWNSANSTEKRSSERSRNCIGTRGFSILSLRPKSLRFLSSFPFPGIGEGEERKKLEEMIGKNGLEKNFKLVGNVEDTSQYLKAFSVFVPSIKEEPTLHNPRSRFCVAFPSFRIVGGIPEIITDMKSGILVQSKNAKELAHAISFMIEHSEERRAYGTALHEKVVKDFSVEHMIQETSRVYQL